MPLLGLSYLARILKGCARPVIAILSMVLIGGTLAYAQNEVVILETKSSPKTQDFISGFEKACDSCSSVTRFDGEGDPRKLAAALKRIKENNPKLVITLGAPATKIASEELSGTPIFTALTNNAPKSKSQKNLYNHRSDGSIVWASQIAKAVVGKDVSIGVLGGVQAIEATKTDISQANAVQVDIDYFTIRSEEELPDQIQKAYANNDFIIFLKDASVVNRRSMNFIIKASISSNKQTLVYSSALVNMGIPFAISPNPNASGKRAAMFTNAFLSGKSLPPLLVPDDFNLHINCAALNRLNDKMKGAQPPQFCSQSALSVGTAGTMNIKVH